TSALAFSAMSALAVPLTAIVPEGKDAFFSILYRFSSIFVAVTATAMLMWVVHHGLRMWLQRSTVKSTTSQAH
ncbi:MFS transporter, partial [Vibrio vulnificus]|nr:MFS transporter [Vibrio vulnificus]